MANLPTDYADDVLDVSKNTNRKYNMIENQDGTVSFEDVTQYQQEGTQYGAGDVNAQNREINALNSRLTLNSGEDIAQFTLDKQGDTWGWNEDPARGADTFHPFSSVDIDYFHWSINQSPITKTYPRDIKGVYYGLRTGDWIAVGYWKKENGTIITQSGWARDNGAGGSTEPFRATINGNTLTFNGYDFAGEVTVIY